MVESPSRLTRGKLLLTPSDFSATSPELRVLGVFNPGAARLGDEVVLLVRVAEECTAREEGRLLSPRSVVEAGRAFSAAQGGARRTGRVRYEIDRLEIHRDHDGDYRKPLTASGHRRLAFISHLEVVRLSPDGRTVKAIERRDDLFGRTPWEEYGVEDPRITKIGDVYYVTYVSVSSEMGVATSLMSTVDFETFERRGVIFPCENKDVVLFPEKVSGRYRAFHRPVGHINIRPLAILSASSPDLLHWGGHAYVLGCADRPGWYSTRIGAGTPPVKTDEGWLSIFHGVRARHAGDPIGEYTAGGLLTALDDPARVLGLSEEPFLRAEEDYEVSGYVKNVVFPTGAVRDLDDPDRLHVYYGCADSCVAVATFSLGEILASLKRL